MKTKMIAAFALMMGGFGVGYATTHSQEQESLLLTVTCTDAHSPIPVLCNPDFWDAVEQNFFQSSESFSYKCASAPDSVEQTLANDICNKLKHKDGSYSMQRHGQAYRIIIELIDTNTDDRTFKGSREVIE